MNNLESLKYFLPEALLVFGIMSVVFLSLSRKENVSSLVFPVATAFLLLVLALLVSCGFPEKSISLFSGMITYDRFGVFFKVIIVIAALVAVLLSHKARDLEGLDKPEFFAFLLATTLGLMLLVVSNNLLMIYLTIEISSILAYLMSGYIAFNKKSEEASLKYVLYGGMASAIMIYGMSLLYGLTGSLNLVEMHEFFLNNATDRLVLFVTFIFILAGLGYKMAIAPFHMWSPDVYEGAPISVTAFLSVASKAGGFAITIKLFLTTFATLVPDSLTWQPIKDLDWQTLIVTLSILTMFVGNLLALKQTNIKRLLAYSSIAHAGYLLMGLATQSGKGLEAILFYFITYLIMNLGAFVCVTLVSRQFPSEEIQDYRGLAKRGVFGLIASFCFGVFLLSLAGLPPFAGFVGKYYLFIAVLDAKLYLLAVMGVLNSVISLYYYVKIMKICFIDEPESETPLQKPYMPFTVVMVVFALLVLYFGVFFSPLTKLVSQSIQFW